MSSASHPPDRIVVVNLTPSTAQVNAEDSSSNTVASVFTTSDRIFSFPGYSPDSVLQNLYGQLRNVNLGLDDAGRAANSWVAQRLKDILENSAELLMNASDTRWISHRGQRLDIYVVRPVDQKADITITQTERESRIVSDVQSLAKIVSRKVFGVLPTPDTSPPPFGITFASYTLSMTRANLDVKIVLNNPAPANAIASEQSRDGGNKGSASSEGSAAVSSAQAKGPANPEESAAASSAQAKEHARKEESSTDPSAQAKAATSDAASITLRTGPAEHFFLSANVTATNVQSLHYNEDTQQLEPASKPTQFFIGMNYALGDLLGQQRGSTARDLLSRLYGGVMIQAAKRPFDQVGLTIGFRGRLFADLLDFNTVSPYYSIVWVKSDRLEGAEPSTTVKRKYGKPQHRFGISLNLDQALKWIPSSSETPKGAGSEH